MIFRQKKNLKKIIKIHKFKKSFKFDKKKIFYRLFFLILVKINVRLMHYH